MAFFLRYLKYLRPQAFRIALSVIAGLVFVVLSGLSFWLVADFIQALFRGGLEIPPLPAGQLGPDNFIEFLKHYSALYLSADTPLATLRRSVIILVAVFLIKNITLYLQTILSASIEQRVARVMRDDLFAKLLDQDLAFFHTRRTGDIVSSVVNDVNALNTGIADSFSRLIRDPVTVLMFLLLLLAISWRLTLAALLIAPLTGIVVSLAGSSLKRKSHRTQQRLANVSSRLNEALYGIRIIHAYGGHGREVEAFGAATGDHFHQALRRERLRRLITPLNETIGIFVIAGILLVAGGQVLGGNWLKSEDFVRFLILLFGLLNPLVGLGEVQSKLKVAEGAAQRVFALMDADFRIRQKPGAIKPGGFRRAIRFENVEMRYDDQREPAITGVNLELRPREHIVLVGRSGSGKSTFLNLLPRFYDPTHGRITLDGRDLRDLDLKSLRRLYGIVTQEVFLFDDSVRANIAYNTPGVPFDTIVEAAKKAHADEFIRELPDGYDTRVGDLGGRISGGQRQRISIARALLHDPPILLLDEPASALDADVAEEIMQTLEQVSFGRTVITATHRLATITAADRVLLFDGGRLIAEGTYEELYHGNELFRDLCDRS